MDPLNDALIGALTSHLFTLTTQPQVETLSQFIGLLPTDQRERLEEIAHPRFGHLKQHIKVPGGEEGQISRQCPLDFQ